MVLARAYERRAMPVPSAGAPRPSRPPVRPQPQSGTTSAPTPTPALPIQPFAAVPPRPFKRLTPAEMSERRRQGLCYNCDERYVRGHKCPRLFYLEVADFDEEAPADDNPSADKQPPLISLHAVTGVRAENTMKLASPLAAGSSRRCWTPAPRTTSSAMSPHPWPDSASIPEAEQQSWWPTVTALLAAASPMTWPYALARRTSPWTATPFR